MGTSNGTTTAPSPHPRAAQVLTPSAPDLLAHLHHGSRLDDGRQVTVDLVHHLVAEELELVRYRVGDERYERGCFESASEAFVRMTLAEHHEELMTLPVYAQMP